MEQHDYIDFSPYPRSKAIYNTGNAGRKMGVAVDGTNWLVKFSQRNDSNNMRDSSYTNSPLGEYLGSHIYGLVGIDVHETVLGLCDNRLVVGCKDFRHTGDQLAEFKGIVSSYPGAEDYPEDQGSGNGTVLTNVLEVIKNAYPLSTVTGVVERFWEMFIVDALIGNSDRNNTNWGIILDARGNYSLAPVYDNGRAFGERFLVQEYGLDPASLLTEDSQLNYQCNFLDNEGNHIKPFEFIARHSNPDCDKVLVRLAQRFDMTQFETLIESTPTFLDSVAVVTKAEKELFIGLLTIRIKLLQETF
jgi:hypothetical protein